MDPRYQEIIRRRAVRASTPSYLSRAAGELGEAAPSLAGFVSVFLYRTGSDVEPLVGRAADGDQAALNELLATATAQQARLSQLIAAGPAVLHLGLVADVRYGGRTLRQGLALPAGVDMVVDQYTFAGGTLDADRFELLEYAEPGGTDDYGALVVAAPAELSDLERQIVDRLPPELTELSISPHDEMWPNVFAQAMDRIADRAITDDRIVRQLDDRLADRMAQRLAQQQLADDLAQRLAQRRLADDLAERLAQRRLADDLAERLAQRRLADDLAERLAQRRVVDDLAQQLMQRRMVDDLAERLAQRQVADDLAQRLAQRRAVDDLNDQGLADRLADRLANQLDQQAIADRLANRLAVDDLGAGAFGRNLPHDALPDQLVAALDGLDPGAAVQELVALRRQLTRRNR